MIAFHFLGFHSEDQSRLAARKYARVVQKLGFPVSSSWLEQYSLSIESNSKGFLALYYYAMQPTLKTCTTFCPVTSKTKTKLLANIFPHFASATCIYFEFLWFS